MDPLFSPHNTHLENPGHFQDRDPQLRQLQKQVYVHKPALLDQLPHRLPGIYTVGGGRQIGKTTLLKQWMAKLLGDGTPPSAIVFFSGELIGDHRTLYRLLQTHLATMPTDALSYVLVDEVSYIRDWDKAVKYAADAGLLENVVLVLTGSDLALIQEARMTFPGRRGQAETVDFHLYPLSFKEVVLLKGAIKDLSAFDSSNTDISPDLSDTLFAEFNRYLIHGGFLTAINDYASSGSIQVATLNTYSDWIRGDMIKRGKQEHYLREILATIIKRYNTQVTWNALARDLSIDHPATVADYAALLVTMDALFIQAALLESKLAPAPKKARKLMFTDPFIFHAIRSWLWPDADPFKTQILTAIDDSILCSHLVEACVTTHYRRYYSTYYIKAEGEIDIAYVHENRFWPIEIKWTEQLRPKDLKQIAKYPNSRIFSKSRQRGKINDIDMTPLPVALLGVGLD